MKKIKKLSTLAIIGTTLLTLTGCSNDKDVSIKEKNISHNISKDVTFADSNDSRIWLLIDANKEEQIAKEATINAVIQTKNGKYVTYRPESYECTLEKIANMKDSDIVSNAKKLDEENFNNQKQRALEDYDDILKYTTNTNDIEKVELARKKIEGITYKTPSWENISINLKKDNNNKETLEEAITLSNRVFQEDTYATVTGSLTFSVPVSTTEVLGEFYTGYATENRKTLLITKVDKEYQKMELDKKEVK